MSALSLFITLANNSKCGLTVPTRSYPAPGIHGPVRLCPNLSDLHRPCSALSGTALFHPALYCLVRLFQPCLTLFCSTLPDAARPCLATRDLVWLCSALSCLALSCPAPPSPAWRCLLYSGWRCLAWPCPALSFPSLSNPAVLCPARPDLPGTVRHCLALLSPV